MTEVVIGGKYRFAYPVRKSLNGMVDIYDENDDIVATVHDHLEAVDEMALARLFAAAPRMLELLRRLDNAVTHLRDLPYFCTHRESVLAVEARDKAHAEISDFLKEIDDDPS